ncbi:MAG: prevent-host-death protein [Rhodospirillales bacterium]|nr:prevent-host-death protein [Rhodospirillales bacterium]MBN8897802.1 prevent-host-death protein [Rhodospirillales bacterium]
MSDPAAQPPAPPRRIGVRELQGNLTRVLHEVRDGASLLITSDGEVVAELRPARSAPSARRRLGSLRGKITIAPDFDVTPGDVRDSVERDLDP